MDLLLGQRCVWERVVDAGPLGGGRGERGPEGSNGTFLLGGLASCRGEPEAVETLQPAPPEHTAWDTHLDEGLRRRPVGSVAGLAAGEGFIF